MNECSPPQESMGRYVRNRGREREREDSATERKGECLYAEFVQVPIGERERDRKRTRETDGESKNENVVWTKGFNKNEFQLS